MELQIKLDSGSEVAERYGLIYPRILTGLQRKLDILNYLLQAKVVGEKLSGDPIKSHTHQLAGSVRVNPATIDGDNVNGSVQAGGGIAFYAKFLEDGTGPHEIVPDKKKALSFVMGGKQVFFRRVMHPGFQAFRFMGSAAEEFAPQVQPSLQDTVNQIIGEANR